MTKPLQPQAFALRPWVMAARPATLWAGILPVALATALAHRMGGARLDVALCAGLGAVLIQIGTNLFNDWADFKRGADTAERLGPRRVTQQGLIEERTVLVAALVSFAAAAVCGLYLIPIGGWPIVVVGVSSIAAGILYTGGPYPLAYHGLGDLFVFVFFGLVAVCATTFLHRGTIGIDSVLCGAALGSLATAILVVNNLRDRHTDLMAHKRTLAVRLGARAARLQYAACLLVPFVVSGVLAARTGFAMLLPLVCAPHAYATWRRVASTDGAALNPLLGATARLELAWTGLSIAALMW